MMQLVGLGAPLVEGFARFFIWLYFPALLCFLVGIRMLKDGLLVLVLRHDLQLPARFQFARRMAFGAVQGFVCGVILVLVIYNRMEIFKCVASLF